MVHAAVPVSAASLEQLGCTIVVVVVVVDVLLCGQATLWTVKATAEAEAVLRLLPWSNTFSTFGRSWIEVERLYCAFTCVQEGAGRRESWVAARIWLASQMPC